MARRSTDEEVADKMATAVRLHLLDLLRTDPEVQGAVLALLAGAIAPPQAQPQERRKPDWVRRLLDESDSLTNSEAAHNAARGAS